MQKILTTALLNSLISQGYRYFLSGTTVVVGDDADICITLLPVKYKPRLVTLPKEYDTYFRADEEPRQMALGINDTIVLVDLSEINAYMEESL